MADEEHARGANAGLAPGTRPGEQPGEERAEQPGEEQPGEGQPEDEAVETPFDHPLFLPVVLAGLSVWFFYDGFINQDPEMLEHLAFNRGGFAVLSAAAAWFGYKGIREMREAAAARPPSQDDPEAG